MLPFLCFFILILLAWFTCCFLFLSAPPPPSFRLRDLPSGPLRVGFVTTRPVTRTTRRHGGRVLPRTQVPFLHEPSLTLTLPGLAACLTLKMHGFPFTSVACLSPVQYFVQFTVRTPIPFSSR
uniref:Putative secreted protein n=1 Tax=Ixodes ricinus TaxID=34613 RepID=A0A6B0UPD2_IXORI